MTNITFGIDSISSRLDFSRALQDLFRDAGDQVSRSQDHLFLFLHCLMSETGFRLDAAEDNFWSQGYWKPEMGRRSCYSTCYKIQEIDDGKVTLRMTPVGSTLVIIGM